VTRDEKIREIEALRTDFAAARHAFLLGFAGLSVAQIEDLRRRVAGTGSAYRVVKNRLAARATEGTPLAPLGAHFRGETGVAYNAGDPVALAKALTEFVKDNPTARLRLGLVDGRDVLRDRELETLAKLPGLGELRARLLSVLQAPATRLLRLVQTPGAQVARVLDARARQLPETSN